MAYRVKVARSAKADAENAYEWMKEQYSEAQAIRWYNGLVDAVYSLADFPRRCPLAPESEEIGTEIRHLLYGKRSAIYHIVFAVVEDVATKEDIECISKARNRRLPNLKQGRKNPF